MIGRICVYNIHKIQNIYIIFATPLKCNISQMKENSRLFNFVKKDMNITSLVQNLGNLGFSPKS